MSVQFQQLLLNHPTQINLSKKHLLHQPQPSPVAPNNPNQSHQNQDLVPLLLQRNLQANLKISQLEKRRHLLVDDLRVRNPSELDQDLQVVEEAGKEAENQMDPLKKIEIEVEDHLQIDLL
jgi:hypothetical protein